MKVYIFRGKSATGKTTLTNKLSQKLNIPILRKDDIFDTLSKYETDIAILNSASYDILAKQIQTCIDNRSDIIVDVALQHTPSLKTFLSKIDFRNSTIHRFFCDCSDDNVWFNRWRERLENPLPNQYFKSIEEIAAHYGCCEIEPIDNEIILDSIFPVGKLIDIVMGEIK